IFFCKKDALHQLEFFLVCNRFPLWVFVNASCPAASRAALANRLFSVNSKASESLSTRRFKVRLFFFGWSQLLNLRDAGAGSGFRSLLRFWNSCAWERFRLEFEFNCQQTLLLSSCARLSVNIRFRPGFDGSLITTFPGVQRLKKFLFVADDVKELEIFAHECSVAGLLDFTSVLLSPALHLVS